MEYVYQGGKLDTIRIPATNGNVAYNYSPDAKRFIVLRGTLYFVAGVGAANRYLHIGVTDGTNLVETIYTSVVVVASGAKILDFGEGRIVVTGILGTVGQEYLGIHPILLECPQQFRVWIDGGLAADQYSGYIQVCEVDV